MWRTPDQWLGRDSRWRVPMWIATGAILVWSAHGSDVQVGALVSGLPNMGNFLMRMFPPNVGALPELIGPTIETLQMAIVGTALAIVMAVPLALCAAGNINPNVTLYRASRVTLNFLRGINEFVFALIFVSSVGLGPFPGVLALAVHTAGMLGKFYAEAAEAVDRGPLEGVLATGANRWQMIRYAVVPQIMPAAVAFSMYRLEVAVRSATVLGLVGAGGIGFQLMTNMRLFKYQDVAMILIVIVALVIVADVTSSRIRRRFI